MENMATKAVEAHDVRVVEEIQENSVLRHIQICCGDSWCTVETCNTPQEARKRVQSISTQCGNLAKTIQATWE